MDKERCRCCDAVMYAAATTFSVVKDTAVYAVKNVPCLECSGCGEVIFDQKTAQILSQYSSGKVWPKKILSAYVFNWGDPIVLVEQHIWEEYKGTVNTSLSEKNSVISGGLFVQREYSLSEVKP